MAEKRYIPGAASADSGGVLQLLPVKQSNHAKITVGASSARTALNGAQAIRLATDVDAYILFGSSSVEAADTSILFEKGTETFLVPSGATHLAYIAKSTTGVGTITELGA